MKKLLLALIVFMCAGMLEASFSNQNMKVWRASETSTADTNVLIATGVIYVYKVEVPSGSVTGSTFQYFNSSTTDLSVTRSTSIVYDVDTTDSDFEIGTILNDGLLYTKTGTSSVRILWDWYIGPNRGQETYGLLP